MDNPIWRISKHSDTDRRNLELKIRRTSLGFACSSGKITSARRSNLPVVGLESNGCCPLNCVDNSIHLQPSHPGHDVLHKSFIERDRLVEGNIKTVWKKCILEILYHEASTGCVSQNLQPGITAVERRDKEDSDRHGRGSVEEVS